MKNILYLTFYYEPDLCAGSFRNSPLIHELARQAKGRAEIDVVTTMPNRYSTFTADCPEREQHDHLKIHRILLPVHKSGFVDQIRSFYTYYRATKKHVRGKKYDLVIASSSRLFTAFLGFVIASRRRIPLYLDIRDIFVDTMNDVIRSKMIKTFLLPVLKLIEKRVFGYASHINLISGGFSEYFKKYRHASYTYFTNGIDDAFLQKDIFSKELPASPVIITYAGNLGEGQGLHKIIPEAAALLGNKYQFRIIGDGGTRKKLEEEIRERGLTNIDLRKPVKRQELLQLYGESHFLFIHLNDYQAFEKVLPSKIFELAAIPRPIVAGVNGFARRFLQNHVPDTILFQPANAAEMVEKLRSFPYHFPDRSAFVSQFKRDRINEEMAKSMLTYL